MFFSPVMLIHLSWQPFSQHTAELIDTEVRQTISVAYNRVCRLLEEKKSLVEALAAHLIDKEVLRHDDLVRMCVSLMDHSSRHKLLTYCQ